MMQPAEVLDFWFSGDPTIRREVWFRGNAGFDTECQRFAEAAAAARIGLIDAWAHEPKSALALVLLLDQFPRNLYRGSAMAFASDARARAVARAAIDRGLDQALNAVERMFLYLPFEHSEALADQDEAVRLYETLRSELGDATVKYAHDHREVIRSFGRFPHRNAALGRPGTADEAAYLAQPGAGF
jgi:uncharacterized protein (DUF924 family)